jgi:hypothetical protein
MNCRYRMGTAYRQAAFQFGLSDSGLHRLQCELVLSRYVGVIGISVLPASVWVEGTCDVQLADLFLGPLRREGLSAAVAETG